MRKEQLPLPQRLKDKYGDELTEFYNNPSKAEIMNMTKEQRIKRNLMK
jgi:hypothetical protein